MSLIDKLSQTTLGPKTPSSLFSISSDKRSILHNTSSINGRPVLVGRKKPSDLDLDGEVSKDPKAYVNKAPKGSRI